MDEVTLDSLGSIDNTGEKVKAFSAAIDKAVGSGKKAPDGKSIKKITAYCKPSIPSKEQNTKGGKNK